MSTVKLRKLCISCDVPGLEWYFPSADATQPVMPSLEGYKGDEEERHPCALTSLYNGGFLLFRNALSHGY